MAHRSDAPHAARAAPSRARCAGFVEPPDDVRIADAISKPSEDLAHDVRLCWVKFDTRSDRLACAIGIWNRDRAITVGDTPRRQPTRNLTAEAAFHLRGHFSQI